MGCAAEAGPPVALTSQVGAAERACQPGKESVRPGRFRLAVLGICVAIAGAVFGAWGMNVRGVPLAWTHIGHYYLGFWEVCALTPALISIALFWTRRRGMW